MGQLRDRSLHFTSAGIALIEEAMQLKDWDKNQLAEQVEIFYELICRCWCKLKAGQVTPKGFELLSDRVSLTVIFTRRDSD